MKNIAIIQPLKYTDIRQDKLIKSFFEKGYKVHIIYSKENSVGTTKSMYLDISEKIEFYNIETKIPVNIPFNFYRNIRVNKIIEKINPNIVICRDIFMSGFIKKNHMYKSYIDICDNFPEVLECLVKNPLNKIAKNIANYYEKKAIQKFKYSIFVSNNSVDYILKKHSLNDINYFVLENVPNKRELGFVKNKRELDFVYIGTINKKIRDIETVINAIEYSTHKGFNITFDLYFFKHQIDIINEYKKIVEVKNLQSNIKFYEAVQLNQLPNILSKYKCGLVPHCRNKATDYTIPNKLYDYLQQGMNVLTSDNPSLIKFADELNITQYYKGGNYKSLSKVMINLVNRQHNIDNKKGKEIINKFLNWENYFEELYKWMEE
ncbi:MAG: hypothetical protein ACLUG9_12175 [Paraclostridium sordellii]